MKNVCKYEEQGNIGTMFASAHSKKKAQVKKPRQYKHVEMTQAILFNQTLKVLDAFECIHLIY